MTRQNVFLGWPFEQGGSSTALTMVTTNWLPIMSYQNFTCSRPEMVEERLIRRRRLGRSEVRLDWRVSTVGRNRLTFCFWLSFEFEKIGRQRVSLTENETVDQVELTIFVQSISRC